MPLDTSQYDPLAVEVARYTRDPLGFVLAAFPWKKPGPLLTEHGPEPWQREILNKLGKGLIDGSEAMRLAVASGHGIGKSALVAWIILWALSTLPDTRGVVTANTEGQLRTKTWPELAKWHRLAVNAHWFVYTATSLYSAQAGRDKTWRVDAISWSENNTEAIAGLHNKGRRAFAIFDEASAIPVPIWETVEGALTDSGTELFWVAFGNPTRNTGRFKECFAGGRFAHRWDNRQIDSRSVSFTNKTQIQSWVDDYGEDSDFVRIRIRGVFPRAGDQQFIDSERVELAQQRDLVKDESAPLVMGVDIARSLSGDASVMRFRKGLDARSLPAVKMRIPDLMQVASRVAEEINNHKPAAVFVDTTGLGSGVYDRLRQLGYDMVVAVNFAEKVDRTPGDDSLYANMRAAMWGRMKGWLKTGCIPESDRDLAADLIGVQYGYDAQNAVLLEKKEDMRKRGLASPDDGDALGLTFAYPVAIRDVQSDHRIAERLAGLRKRVL